MKKEKIILYFIATSIGLLVSGAVFYLYQTTKTVEESKREIITKTIPSPTLVPSSFFLALDSPKDEEVVNKKIITISGKTTSDAIIVIFVDDSEQIITPALDGSFSTTQTLNTGQNVIEVTAIGEFGEEKKLVRTVTLSNEEF